MKTREFDINNYQVQSVIKDEIQNAADAYLKAFKHDFMLEGSKEPYYVSMYNISVKSFANMSKKEQASIEKLAFTQYETKKAKTIEEWETLKAKCDHIFGDDKQYLQFLLELDSLYYCQAVTALNDYLYKKLRSNAAANAKYKARAMQYFTIACD
jgi:hypothetical protein